MAAQLLADHEILHEIEEGRLIVTGTNIALDRGKKFDAAQPIQPSSLDLRIGRIMVPPASVDQDAQAKADPLMMKSAWLNPGETVVVETSESITLDGTLAAFGFPPAHLSRNAILMTNPGHVDPGFSGHLSFTLINMGRDRYYLEEGEPIVSLLVFRFLGAVEKDYKARYGATAGTRNYWSILNRLAPDFASLNKRVSVEVKGAVAQNLNEFSKRGDAAEQSLKDATRKFDRAQLYVPALVAVLTLVGARGIDWLIGGRYAEVQAVEEISAELDALDRQIASTSTVASIESRFDDLQEQIEMIRDEMSKNAQ